MSMANVRNGLVCGVWFSVLGGALCCFAGSSQVDVPYSPPAADLFGNHWTIGPSSIGQAGNQPVYKGCP